MTIASRLLAAGPGWRANDVVCAAGPTDRPFEERHATVTIAAVRAGAFAYRSSQGAALLAPGAVLLGDRGACFSCGHDHSRGDRCLSLHFEPDYWESLVAALPGARGARFALPALPPLEALAPALARLEAAEADDAARLEECAIDFAETALRAIGAAAAPREPGARAARFVCDAVRRIETAVEAGEPTPDLSTLADGAGVDRFHFLRSFGRCVGATPHNYGLGLRLRRAARRLVDGDEPVTAVAFEAGFGDLSSFHRRFRRITGVSPLEWRRRFRLRA